MSFFNNITASTYSSFNFIENEEEDYIGYEYLYILPSIIIFGVIGNFISLVAILNSRLRKIGANQYLILLTVADSVFLLGLLLIWIKLDYYAYQCCVIIEYILQVASYISSWSISILTVERYLAIVHPLKHMKFSYVNRFKLMKFWVPIPFILNSIQFFILIESEQYNARKCVPENGKLQIIVEMFDILLCYVLPCAIVIILNLAVARKVKSSKNTLMPEIHVPEALIILNGNLFHEKQKQKRSKSLPNGTIRTLLVVPVVYILLNTPFYLIRFVDTIAINFFEDHEFDVQGEMNEMFIYIYNTAYYLYYINFAIDAIVYAFSSSSFRKTVVIAWKHILFHDLFYDENKNKAAVLRLCQYSLSPTSRKPLEPRKV